MKIKCLSLYLIITILLFSVLFASGCSLLDFPEKITGEYERDPLLPANEKAMDEAIAEAEREMEEEEVIEGFEEQEELFPDETIKYHTQLTGTHYEHLEGLEFILEVNFKTQKVIATGVGGKANKSFSAPGEMVNMETLEVYVEVGDWEFVDAIMGNISEDLSRFDGAVLSQSINYGFTATRS